MFSVLLSFSFWIFSFSFYGSYIVSRSVSHACHWAAADVAAVYCIGGDDVWRNAEELRLKLIKLYLRRDETIFRFACIAVQRYEVRWSFWIQNYT